MQYLGCAMRVKRHCEREAESESFLLVPGRFAPNR
jgi:hypothetical protein